MTCTHWTAALLLSCSGLAFAADNVAGPTAASSTGTVTVAPRTDTATSPAASTPAPVAPAITPAPGPAAAAPAASAAPAPFSGAGSPAGFPQLVLGMFAVIALLAGITWFLKRAGMVRPQSGAVARILGGVSVGKNERVMVVEVADQWIVVGVAPGRVNALATLPRQEAGVTTQMPSSAIPAAGAPNFSAWLKQTVERQRRNGAP